jgi:hypothetical protein
VLTDDGIRNGGSVEPFIRGHVSGDHFWPILSNSPRWDDIDHPITKRSIRGQTVRSNKQTVESRTQPSVDGAVRAVGGSPAPGRLRPTTAAEGLPMLDGRLVLVGSI